MSDPKGFTIGDVIAETAGILTNSGVPQARLEAMSLLGHILGRDRTYLITHPESPLAAVDLVLLYQFIEQRAAGKPLQYITGHQSFYGLDFAVTPEVLIPRPETELLVETAIELLKVLPGPQLICDVGTGSGCIAIALLHERLGLRAVGLDVSTEALNVAARNAETHNTRERLALIASDCFAALDSAETRFEMIVSNPPYIGQHLMAGLQREVKDHEPHVALTAGGDGLDVILRILSDAPPFLRSGGYLLIEIGFDQHDAIRALIDQTTWELLDIRKDLQEIPRVVVLKRR